MVDIKAVGMQAFQKFAGDAGLQVLRGHGATWVTKSGVLKNIRVHLTSSSGEFFSLQKKRLNDSDSILAYVWNADVDPAVFVMTPREALDFLGPKPQLTDSWRHSGYYKWSSSAGLPPDRREQFIARFSNRGQWLKSQFG